MHCTLVYMDILTVNPVLTKINLCFFHQYNQLFWRVTKGGKRGFSLLLGTRLFKS